MWNVIFTAIFHLHMFSMSSNQYLIHILGGLYKLLTFIIKDVYDYQGDVGHVIYLRLGIIIGMFKKHSVILRENFIFLLLRCIRALIYILSIIKFQTFFWCPCWDLNSWPSELIRITYRKQRYMIIEIRHHFIFFYKYSLLWWVLGSSQQLWLRGGG